MAQRRKYTKELLEPIVKQSKSIADVIRALGLKEAGGTYTHIKFRLNEFNIDYSHFTGSLWSKGETAETHSSIMQMTKRNSYSDEVAFSINSPVTGLSLVKRLLRMGWEYKCGNCSLAKWLDKEITLDLDHINGIRNDNRLENLRFLCPNCHRQTKTWGNKKR